MRTCTGGMTAEQATRRKRCSEEQKKTFLKLNCLPKGGEEGRSEERERCLHVAQCKKKKHIHNDLYKYVKEIQSQWRRSEKKKKTRRMQHVQKGCALFSRKREKEPKGKIMVLKFQQQHDTEVRKKGRQRKQNAKRRNGIQLSGS